MKLSKNLAQELKLHAVFCIGLLPCALLLVVAFHLPLFDATPLGAKIGLGVLCAVLLYAWWRQCLSPDKLTFTPKWW